jgi:hypothetical protein
MARPRRLHVPHATYYVVDRFKSGVEVLVADPTKAHSPHELERIVRNRQQFEQQLRALHRRWGMQVDAHCWLPDAALFVLHISFVSLEEIMHSLRGTYAHYLRHVAGMGAPCYSGRYHALLIDADTYLLDFARHVLCAPARLRLSKSALEYPHNSFGAWLGGAKADFLAQSRVPEALAHRGWSARSGMAKFVQAQQAPEFPSLMRRGSRWDNRIAGNERFVRKVQRGAGQARRSDSIEPSIVWVCGRLGIAVDVVKSPKRSHAKTLAHALAAWLLTRTGRASLSAVARRIPCGKSTLHKDIEHNGQARRDLFNNTMLNDYLEYVQAAPGDRRWSSPAEPQNTLEDLQTPRRL